MWHLQYPSVAWKGLANWLSVRGCCSKSASFWPDLLGPWWKTVSRLPLQKEEMNKSGSESGWPTVAARKEGFHLTERKSLLYLASESFRKWYNWKAKGFSERTDSGLPKMLRKTTRKPYQKTYHGDSSMKGTWTDVSAKEFLLITHRSELFSRTSIQMRS